MKQTRITWYNTIQALSLDVVLGAVIFSIAIGKFYQVQLSIRILLSMSIAIWLIYTTDHLLDARRIKGKAATYRHRFHQKNQKILTVVAIVLLFVGIINALYLPKIIFLAGGIGVVLVFLYFFVLQKTAFWAKEIWVSLLYTFGIFIGPLYFFRNSIEAMHYILIAQVFLLVFSNLIIFSWFDYLKDKRDGHRSLVTHIGTDRAKMVINFILYMGLLCSAILIIINFNERLLAMEATLICMQISLMLIFKRNELFRKNDLYRIIGDGIFFMPLIFIAYAAIRQL